MSTDFAVPPQSSISIIYKAEATDRDSTGLAEIWPGASEGPIAGPDSEPTSINTEPALSHSEPGSRKDFSAPERLLMDYFRFQPTDSYTTSLAEAPWLLSAFVTTGRTEAEGAPRVTLTAYPSGWFTDQVVTAYLRSAACGICPYLDAPATLAAPFLQQQAIYEAGEPGTTYLAPAPIYRGWTSRAGATLQYRPNGRENPGWQFVFDIEIERATMKSRLASSVGSPPSPAGQASLGNCLYLDPAITASVPGGVIIIRDARCTLWDRLTPATALIVGTPVGTSQLLRIHESTEVTMRVSPQVGIAHTVAFSAPIGTIQVTSGVRAGIDDWRYSGDELLEGDAGQNRKPFMTTRRRDAGGTGVHVAAQLEVTGHVSRDVPLVWGLSAIYGSESIFMSELESRRTQPYGQLGASLTYDLSREWSASLRLARRTSNWIAEQAVIQSGGGSARVLNPRRSKVEELTLSVLRPF